MLRCIKNGPVPVRITGGCCKALFLYALSLPHAHPDPFPSANDPAPMKKFGKALLALLVLLLLAAALFLYWPLTQRSVPAASNDKPVDVVLVGAGIMSITLATYLQELQPDWNIQVYERLDGVAGESSDGWNNAGTGHSAFAELNYTPELPDGSIETKRAVGIAESFEVSRQFWSHQVKQGG